MRSRLILIAFVVAYTIQGCNKTPDTLEPAEYLSWISAEDNGYVKTKSVSNVTITARYLPTSYLAYRDFLNSSDENISFDSVHNTYRCGLSFQVTLRADKSDRTYGQLKYYNLKTQDEFPARVRDLNFGANDFFSLSHNGRTLTPVMNVFEGFDDLDNRLSFIMVFEVDEYNCGHPPADFDNITFTFNDRIWELGTNHFVFQKDIFQNKPKLRFK